MWIVTRLARWVLRNELQVHEDDLIAARADFENLIRVTRPFMDLRGGCLVLALKKQDRPLSYYQVSRFDYWCLAFYWNFGTAGMFKGFHPLRLGGIPIIWEGNSFFRYLDCPDLDKIIEQEDGILLIVLPFPMA